MLPNMFVRHVMCFTPGTDECIEDGYSAARTDEAIAIISQAEDLMFTHGEKESFHNFEQNEWQSQDATRSDEVIAEDSQTDDEKARGGDMTPREAQALEPTRRDIGQESQC
eukprot:6927469-Karenia_brevis.AAC.1